MNESIANTSFTPARLAGAVIGSLALMAGNAHAMNGAQLGGYGIKNAGMGGASIALPLDASAAANNPAGMAFVPNSFAQNFLLFRGQSSIGLFGNPLEDNTNVLAPEGGFNWVISPTMTAGLTASGSGAGVDFGKPAVPAPGAENVKASQKVAEIVSSVTWKVQPNLAIGLGLNLMVQQVSTQGVVVQPVPGMFVPVPGHGTQTATGFGARIGVLWNASPEISLGATYKTKTNMSQLGDYANDVLAYSAGKIDIPSEYGIGLAWKATPTITVAADYLQIQYAGIKANQDPAGPGWKDQPVFRLGVAWDVNPIWTLRGGLSSNQAQIESVRAAQNFMTPAINDKSYTAGASMKLDNKADISFSIELNPSVTLDGSGPSTGVSITSKTQVWRLGYQRAF